ncbi:HmuY family protein [Empedobacter brevis]
MKKIFIYTLLFSLSFLWSCNEDSHPIGQDFVVAFKHPSIDFSKIDNEETIQLIYSKVAEQDGQIHIKITEDKATYNVDYSTSVAVTNHEIILPIKKGETSTSFTFKNLIYPFDRSDKLIQFEITKIDYPESIIKGNTSTKISFEVSIGGSMDPEIGGPNQPYQVFIDLSKDTQTKVKRDSWDLGFYNGTYFRVELNSSIYMAVKALDETDLSKVTKASVGNLINEVAVGTFVDSNKEYIDHPAGDILQTAIDEIKETDNPVYLLNMGYEVGTATPAAGSAAVAGNPRGWKKVKFIKRDEQYVMQYANLDETTYQEKVISKNTTHNFVHFSFTTNDIVYVEPPKLVWDLNFTVFTNLIEGNGSYGYSDFVVNNLKAGAKAYRVDVTDKITYETFNESMIDESKFMNDQRAIGDSWRQVTEPQKLFSDRFYIIKDAENNYYKIRMLAFLTASGVRGYPKFEYKLIK